MFLLVGLSLLLLTASFGDKVGGPFATIQRGMMQVLSPVQEVASEALKPVRDLVNWVDDTFQAKGERDKLRKERDALIKQVNGGDQAQRENTQLKSLLGLDREASLSQYKPVTARVIGRSPTIWYATLNVNVGSNNGVSINDAVIAGSGLVGKITTVTGGAAQVTLITDQSSAVSAKINPTGVTGLVRPAVGDPNDLLVDFIDRKDAVKKGQRVVTSGTRSSRLDSLFPPGIPIGWVSDLETGEVDLYQRVHIKPYADLEKLDFVQVLTKPASGRSQ